MKKEIFKSKLTWDQASILSTALEDILSSHFGRIIRWSKSIPWEGNCRGINYTCSRCSKKISSREPIFSIYDPNLNAYHRLLRFHSQCFARWVIELSDEFHTIGEKCQALGIKIAELLGQKQLWTSVKTQEDEVNRWGSCDLES